MSDLTETEFKAKYRIQKITNTTAELIYAPVEDAFAVAHGKDLEFPFQDITQPLLAEIIDKANEYLPIATKALWDYVNIKILNKNFIPPVEIPPIDNSTQTESDEAGNKEENPEEQKPSWSIEDINKVENPTI